MLLPHFVWLSHEPRVEVWLDCCSHRMPHFTWGLQHRFEKGFLRGDKLYGSGLLIKGCVCVYVQVLVCTHRNTHVLLEAHT